MVSSFLTLIPRRLINGLIGKKILSGCSFPFVNLYVCVLVEQIKQFKVVLGIFLNSSDVFTDETTN